MTLRIITALLLLPLFTLAQEEPVQIPLWEDGAPGFEDRRDEPEQAEDWWVKNVHNPSITVYQPKNPNGTAVVICPGGGHRALVYNSEGRDAAEFFNNLGVTAFVLKYRLGREKGSPYSIEKHAKQDGIRAMQFVRSQAERWQIDPDKIGMMGFSAGGEVVSMVTYAPEQKDPDSSDPVKRASSKPDFQILVYPGPLGIPETIPSDVPPAFMVVANDDECCSSPVVEILQKYREVGASVEAHIYAKGGHAFNMGYRTDLKTLSSWPQRMVDWMVDNGIIPQ